MEMETVVKVTDLNSGKAQALLTVEEDSGSRKLSSSQFCRICFEGEQYTPSASSCLSCLSSGPVDPADPLIRPCLCSGTAASVHLMCLQMWQAHSKSSVCELCKAPFEIPKGLRVLEMRDAMDQQAPTGSLHDGKGRHCIRSLVLTVAYIILVLIPMTAMVVIISMPLGSQWTGETALGTSWGMLVRVIISLLVLGVYVLAIYCCIFRRGCLLNWLNTDRQRERWSLRNLRIISPHNTERNRHLMRCRRFSNQTYSYIDAAFML